MMIHAYDENFLDDATETLGSAVEYAVLQCHIDGSEFLKLFVVSGIAKEFEAGNPLFISGKSGVELACTILSRVGEMLGEIKDLPYIDYPPEYWIGWILAYYQWETAIPFEKILEKIPYDTIYNLYGVLHEADPRKSVDTFNMILTEERETNLARIRKQRGLSQSDLAKQSGVSIRSIQLFEQRKTNINNAQYNNLSAIASALKCEITDLTE